MAFKLLRILGHTSDSGLPVLTPRAIIIPTDTWDVRICDGVRNRFIATPPVGFVYTQFPGETAPGTLFPGTTWSNISSNFAGKFFRAEGGAASAFGAGAQAGQNLSHSHGASAAAETTEHSHTIGGSTGNTSVAHTHQSGMANTSAGGVRVPTANTYALTEYITTTGMSGNDPHSHTLPANTAGRSASHTHTITVNADGGSEVRPVNQTVRIWKRTA